MNTRPLEALTHISIVEDAMTETERLAHTGFSPDEIISLVWLRQWYQNGGSDRVEIVRQLEFLKSRVLNNDLSL